MLEDLIVNGRAEEPKHRVEDVRRRTKSLRFPDAGVANLVVKLGEARAGIIDECDAHTRRGCVRKESGNE